MVNTFGKIEITTMYNQNVKQLKNGAVSETTF